ncbi:Os12g0535400, partial [Oryza sativa Japonica Group]
CQIHWQAVDPAFGLPPVDPTAQSLAGAEDSELARRLRGPAVAMGKRLSFMNAYLAEDCNPVRCWVITAAVAFVTLIVLGVGSVDDTPVELPKKLYIGPPSAKTIQLPDGRHLAYKEQGVTADRARFSLIAPHYFLSSRLAGIPGIKPSLLEKFGARLVIIN